MRLKRLLTGDTGSGQQGQASHEEVDGLFWTFPSVTGVDVDLIEGGRNVRVKKEEGKAYWKAVSDLRQKEEEAKEQVSNMYGHSGRCRFPHVVIFHFSLLFSTAPSWLFENAQHYKSATAP